MDRHRLVGMNLERPAWAVAPHQVQRDDLAAATRAGETQPLLVSVVGDEYKLPGAKHWLIVGSRSDRFERREGALSSRK
jgi:hypothetical protein